MEQRNGFEHFRDKYSPDEPTDGPSKSIHPVFRLN